MSHAMRVEIGAKNAAIIVVALLLLLAGIPIGRCQPPVDGRGSAASDDAISQYISETLYTRLQNISGLLSAEIGDRLDYCILNREKDWNEAFNFSSNLTFLSECVKTTNDLGQRICTSAEIKFYFNGLYGSGGSSSFLRPNKNCNRESWISGCEPGWACSSEEENIYLQDSKEIPGRKKKCQPCCEGFFCPHGITCMMPCPLGSYCPTGKLNNTTGLCSPCLLDEKIMNVGERIFGLTLTLTVIYSVQRGTTVQQPQKGFHVNLDIIAGWVLHPCKDATRRVPAKQCQLLKTSPSLACYSL